MSTIVLDDHLLRDLLVDETAPALDALLDERHPATTNMYLYRLCRALEAAQDEWFAGKLTAHLPVAMRALLNRVLVREAADIEIAPMRHLALRMAELSKQHRVSTLGAEALAAAEHLAAPLCVWERDDGPAIRTAAEALGLEYVVVAR